ncbi:hypothetical protein [Methanococcus maripaludis]|uniref:HEPN domain-containing protein n=1 Tax=Methanococcus maripaludis TaxID=39152 RepID=A0A7J9PUJ5_METMI|nr:hypothetical protein [Methanococcus maripaludis]MBA2869449.1 hypothetical protein [Methanococcus maripaludis]
MDEYIDEGNLDDLIPYLPIFFIDDCNRDYLVYLKKAYLKNAKCDLYGFAFMAYHMLFMSIIYRKIWVLKHNLPQTHIFHTEYENLNKKPKKLDSPFRLSVPEEKKCIGLLKSWKLDHNMVKRCEGFVTSRDSLAHASGEVVFTEGRLRREIANVLECVTYIQDKYAPDLDNIFSEFLKDQDNWNVEDYSSEPIQNFLKNNLISSKDLDYLANIYSIKNILKIKKDRVLTEKQMSIYFLYLTIIRVYCIIQSDYALFFEKLGLLKRFNEIYDPKDCKNNFSPSAVFENYFLNSDENEFYEELEKNSSLSCRLTSRVKEIEGITGFDLSDFE